VPDREILILSRDPVRCRAATPWTVRSFESRGEGPGSTGWQAFGSLTAVPWRLVGILGDRPGSVFVWKHCTLPNAEMLGWRLARCPGAGARSTPTRSEPAGGQLGGLVDRRSPPWGSQGQPRRAPRAAAAPTARGRLGSAATAQHRCPRRDAGHQSGRLLRHDPRGALLAAHKAPPRALLAMC